MDAGLTGEQNPFLRYRAKLDLYERVTSGDVTDERLVEIIATIDDRIASVWGHGFVISPLIDGAELALAAEIDAQLSIKVEVNGVGGSHKARHLMGVMLHQVVSEEIGAPVTEQLAIASCGNAAIGASVIARAMDRLLDVFVPTWADDAVVETLNELGANVNRCERREGERGDPCYLRFSEAVASGATAFSVQGTDTPTTFDGAKTLGFEIAEQAGPVDAMYIQVGGGALATSVARGVPDARLYPVQSEGCAPLKRAWDRWGPDFDLEAAQHPNQTFMTPWDSPESFATGILDDITYDWIPLLQQTKRSGGHPVVANEEAIKRAYALAHEHTAINVCSTGTAGLAGLLTEPLGPDQHGVLLFTGIDRS